MRLEGQLIGLFSFDIGYEIDLERSRRLVASAEKAGLEKRRAAPAYVAYAKAPLLASLGQRDVQLGDALVTATVSAVLHDDENLPFVYIALPDGSFVRRHVTLGYRDSQNEDVTSGLSAGDRIVSNGALFLQFMQSQ